MNATGDYPDELLLRCWKQQFCGGCLNQTQCSWCPFTQSCVPNLYSIQLLAPAYDEDICPHWAERWEIRTHPFGCQVSTITSLTGLISIMSTLLVVLLVWLLTIGIRRLRKFNGRQEPGWWKVWLPLPEGILGYSWMFWRWSDKNNTSREQEPLLAGP